MHLVDIYLQPSIDEGFCNAVIEAQAMGLLCIATDAGGLPENIIHEKTGWLVPKRSSDLIARQIIKVLQMKKVQRDEVINRAIDRIKKDYNLSIQNMHFADFYNLPS